jgi:hypothetical protein
MRTSSVIGSLEDEREGLRQDLRKPNLSDAERVAMQGRLSVIDARLEALLTPALPPPAAATPFSEEHVRLIVQQTLDAHRLPVAAAPFPVENLLPIIRQALAESLPQAVTKHQLLCFMNSRYGICGAESASSADRQDSAWERRRQDAFGSCLVTGTPVLRGTQPRGVPQAEFKMAHIVQRKIKNSPHLMELFDMTIEALESDGNALLLRRDVKSAFDRLDFCFFPAAAGLGCFEVVWMPPRPPTAATQRPHDYRASVVMPEFVSRRMLMIQAMDAHRGRMCRFDATRWTGIGPRPGSPAPLVTKWLDGQLAQTQQRTSAHEDDDDA